MHSLVDRKQDRNRSECSIEDSLIPSNSEAKTLSSDKRNYFKWRESWIGYEDFDSRFDEDEAQRRQLSITVQDEHEWREMKDAAFVIEF